MSDNGVEEGRGMCERVCVCVEGRVEEMYETRFSSLCRGNPMHNITILHNMTMESVLT